MSNDRIRISFTEYYPLVNGLCSRVPNFHVSQGCPRPGISIEIITLLTKYLNLTIDVTKVRSHRLSVYNYIFDELDNNETDTSSMFFDNSSTRAIKYDFTKELYSVYIKIFARRTDHSLKSFFDFFNVYRLDTWISIIVVLVLFTAFGLLVRYVECQLMLRKRCNFTEVLWKMIRFQLVQPEGINYKLIAGGSSLLVFSIFQICIILGLFQGFILTSIVKKVNLASFTSNDFPQLVKDKKLFVVVSPTSLLEWYYQELNTSYESPFYELREALKSNPYKLVENSKDVLRTVDEGNGAIAFIREGFWYSTLIAQSYCNLVPLDSLIRPEKQRLMFKKGSRFVPMFNKAIDANRYLIERIRLKYFKHQPPSKCASQKTGPTPLSMAPYYSLLILFFVGMSSACFVFSGELLKWKMSRALTSGAVTEGASNSADNLTVTAVDAPMDSKQSMLLTVGNGRNPPILMAPSARIVANFIAAAGLPPGTKLYALIPQNNQS